jgi:hypothetical protein
MRAIMYKSNKHQLYIRRKTERRPNQSEHELWKKGHKIENKNSYKFHNINWTFIEKQEEDPSNQSMNCEKMATR